MPLRIRRDEAGCRRGRAMGRRIDIVPLPRHERPEQSRRGGVDPGRARGGAVVADDAAQLGDEGVVRTRGAAARVAQAGRPAGERHGAQKIGVQDAARGVLAACQCSQAAHEQEVLLGGRLGLVEAIGRFDHRTRGGIPVVVHHDVGAVRPQRLRLLDDVEGAAFVELHIRHHERLEPSAEAGRRAPHALGDRPDLAVAAAQQREDAIGFTQLVGAQDHDLVAVSGHASIIRRRTDVMAVARSAPRGGCRRRARKATHGRRMDG